MKSATKVMFLFMAAQLILCICSVSAGAATAPASGDFGYPFYDLLVNKGAKGPVGSAIGVAFLGVGLWCLGKGALPGAILASLAAGGLFKIEEITQSLGAIV